MTTIVAVRKHGRTCIVSDSLVTFGKRRKEASGHLIPPTSKLFFYKNEVIGYAGSLALDCFMIEFLKSSATVIGSSDSQAIQAVFSMFWSELKRKYDIAQISHDRFTSFSCCQIVLALPDSLFEITVEGCAIENKNIVAIGGGAPFSYGAMMALDGLTEDPGEIAMAGIKAAAAWDPNTSGPFSGWDISAIGEFSEFATL